MKRHGFLFEKVVSLDNLILAHENASKGKAKYSEVVEVNNNSEHYLRLLQQQLINQTYTLSPSDYTHKVIKDKGKLRDLYKLCYYPHRIVQWAIINVIGKIITDKYSSCSYASIEGRGIHKALRDLRSALKSSREDTQYCFKFDVKKFYQNIDNRILFSMLEAKIKDKKLLSLLNTIVFSRGDVGQPIGSLLSQYLANLYLTPLDNYLKRDLGLVNVFRYMDDVVILHSDKKHLHLIKWLVEDALKYKLNLELKDNWQVFPVYARGIDFVGYRFFHERTILRKRIYVKARKAFSKGDRTPSFYSYYGWAKHACLPEFKSKHGLT